MRGLASDRRGAIMVGGVFMAALLAGALFMLIGTGDAIIYRERLQDAADATAYTSAAVHARGMNLIVMVNLIMAALLAVLIALKALIAALDVAIAVCTALSLLSAGTLGAVCAPVTSSGPALRANLEQAAKGYQKMLGTALPALSKLGRVVALATPYVALHESVTVVGHYQPLAERGFAVSPSMVPLVPDGKRLGLPVEEMDPDEFCKKSAKLGVTHALFWAPSWVKTALGKLAGAVVGSFAGHFCGSSSSGTATAVSANADALCDEQKKACLADAPGAKFCAPKGDGTMSFDEARCRFETKNEIKQALSPSAQAGSFNAKLGTPKQIWNGAKHGGVWFSVWGVAVGDRSWPRRMDRGVAIASLAGFPAPDTRWGNLRLTQAEFFFDRAGKWSALAPRSMWEMAWRARLRRLDLPGPAMGSVMLSALVGKLEAALGSEVRDLIDNGTIGRMFQAASYREAGAALNHIDAALPADVLSGSSAPPSWQVIH